MKILLVNKFLHPNGGAETYLFKLGEALTGLGHEVQYFGMAHPNRVVGNRVGAYTKNMDFHGGAKLTYAVKTIYSGEARKKIRLVLEDFQPDVCHLNNFNYQLTPSIILEIRKWSRDARRPCKIIYTAHDYQLVCPNHMCYSAGKPCETCLGGHYGNCVKGRCIHGSLAKSVIGALEGAFWRRMGVYREMDAVICCSGFLKTKLDTHPHLVGKTVVMHNFAEPVKPAEKGEYVLYFGRYSREKGVEMLAQTAKELPEISFLFAGSGPLEHLLKGIPNVRNVGFQRGEALTNLIRRARFAVCPSQWYENCPLSVLESLSCGTPVLGAAIGGIPELIRPGENGALFESGNREDLKKKLREMWENPPRVTEFAFDTAKDYARKLAKIYQQGI